MRLIFAGTPDFSTGALKALIDAGHQIVGVYCQPDRPKGRGRVLSACPVKELALANQLPVFQPESLKDDVAQAQIKALEAEVMVVVAYGQILPKAVLEMPEHGCLNIHASLLPRWRGAAPIQRAILSGDKTTGVGIMQMDEGLDTGDILLEKICDIDGNDTAQSLHDKLSDLGAKAIVEALDKLDQLSATRQAETGVSYAQKLKKDEAWINWDQPAKQIHRQIRAFNPYPIAQAQASGDKFEQKVLRIIQASVVDVKHQSAPGAVIECNKQHCIVATGDGALQLERVQLSGKKAVDIKDFLNAYQLNKLE